jgi:hypothetical protein
MFMATRSRGTSTRAPKAAPPFAGDVLQDEKTDKRSEAAREESSGQARSDAQITGGSLERREIPSFSDDREQRIAEAAYWRAERRGFKPGHELEDWLEAEREIDGQRSPDPSLDQRPDGRTA